MIKNKDGSYNKFSLLIFSLIILVGIGIIVSLIFQTDTLPDIGLNIVLMFIGIIVAGLAARSAYRIYKGNNSNPIKIMGTIPVKNNPPTAPLEIKKLEVKESKSIERTIGHSTNIVSLVITLIVAAATLMIGMTVANSMMQAIQESIPTTTNSTFNTQMTQITDNVGTAFNFLALGLLVMSVVAIIAFISQMVGGDGRRDIY